MLVWVFCKLYTEIKEKKKTPQPQDLSKNFFFFTAKFIFTTTQQTKSLLMFRNICRILWDNN